MNPLKLAVRLNSCIAARCFVADFKSVKDAWEACPRGDWLLWTASSLGVDRKLLMLAKVECASTAKHLMNDERSIRSLEVAKKYALGEATEQELSNAAIDAHAAFSLVAYDASRTIAAYATYAAYAATEDVRDADMDSCAADDAATAIYEAEMRAGASACPGHIAKYRNQTETANICRKLLTNAVFEQIEKMGKEG